MWGGERGVGLLLHLQGRGAVISSGYLLPYGKTKGNRNELDIVALKLEKGQAVVAEVKRQKKNFKPELLASKVEHFKHKVLSDYTIETVCLSLDGM
jgi:hypothetical protein